MSKRINFSKQIKMHRVCSSDTVRQVLQCVYFSNGYAYATNNKILVKNKIQEISSLSNEQIELLNNKLLHKDSYREILKYDTITISDKGITCFKEEEHVFFKFSTLNKPYPNVEDLITKILDAPCQLTSSVALQSDYIIRLQQSLYNSKYCKFYFKGEDQPILVSCEFSESIGLIIPDKN
jgi:hypothetical protein